MTVYSPAELRRECKRVAFDLKEIDARIVDTIIMLLDGAPGIGQADKDLEDVMLKANKLAMIYHWMPWDDNAKFDKVMKILQKGEDTHDGREVRVTEDFGSHV